MPAMGYTLSTTHYVSDEMRAALRRRMHEMIGAVLLGLAGIAAVALATWSVQDPSLSHATNAPVRNMLGLTGAISADLMMQLLGIATIAFLFPVAAWGWRLVTHRPLDRERTRLALWIVGAIAAAAFASCLPPSKAGPLPTGLGDALLRAPAWLFGAPLSGATRFIVAIVIGIAAFVALALAAGFGWRETEDDEASEAPAKKTRKKKEQDVAAADETEDDEPERRSSAFVGRLYHLGYSIKAQVALLPSMLIGLLLRRRARVVPLRRDPSAVTLVDPHVEAYSNPAQDQAEEIEEEEEAAEEPKKRARPAPKPVVKRKGGYELPSLALLTAPKATDRLTLSTEAIEENARRSESVLSDFGVRGEIINAHPGPVVTFYELEPAPGIKSSRVIGLADDIARSMSKVSARVAVVPG